MLSVPVEELAEAERIPVPTVYDRLRRAREIHRVRLYRRTDIRAALAAAGFSARLQTSYGRCALPAGDMVALALPRRRDAIPDAAARRGPAPRPGTARI